LGILRQQVGDSEEIVRGIRAEEEYVPTRRALRIWQEQAY